MHASHLITRTSALCRRQIFCTAVAMLLLPKAAYAQTTPEIDYLFPPGAQRGTQAEIMLTGKFMPGPCEITTAGRGLSTESTGVTDRVVLNLAADAELGVHELRISSAQGGSPPFPFLVGDIPEVTRQNSRERMKPKLPVTINARLEQDRDIHEYSLPLSAGQQIVCAAVTGAFGSPVDATMRLLDSGGQIVGKSFDNRSADELLVYRAVTAGEFTLQFFDFSLSGSERHIYRLTLTDGPWLDYAFPAGITRGKQTEVTLYGWNLPGPDGRTMQQTITAEEAGPLDVSLPGAITQLTLNVTEEPSHLETEPNNSPEEAEQITSPVAIYGRLQEPEDTDCFAFSAKKGDKLLVELAATNLQSPLDGVLSIVDEAGKSLQEVDDGKTSRDPSITFTAPADGKFFISLRDRSLRGGEEYFYRLRITPPKPDVAARIDVASFALPSGETAKLPIKVQRTGGFEGELEVVPVHLPSGLTASPQDVPKGAAATVQMEITAAEKLGPTGGLCHFLVRTKDAEPAQEWPVEVYANAKATTSSPDLYLAVIPEIPFTLSTTNVILDAPRLSGFPFPVSVTRKDGFSGEIKLVGVEPDLRGSVVPLEGFIPQGSNKGFLPLVIQYGVREGTTQRCRVMGVVKVTAADGKSYPVFHIAPGNMLMGCGPSFLTMTAQPEVLLARPDSTHTLKVQLMKHVQMQEITIQVELPEEFSGVHCEPVLVSSDQEEAVLTLKFDADAKFPPRSEVTIRAESIHAGLPVYGQASFRLESP